ncbi:MAG TPA: LysE family transporter [Fluviicola sp.]|nr:LysE family transporter [Fluviicola sp.]
MGTVVLIFLLTALISFAGSLQVGPVNYFVMETGIRQNTTAAILVAAGGSVPEFIYSLLAITLGMTLQQHPWFFLLFKWITILLLAVLGLYYFLKKTTRVQRSETSKKGSFLKGFILGALNPQLLPFWLVVYTSVFTSTGLSVTSFAEQLAFILGTGIGAFGLHVCLIYLVQANRQRLEKWLIFPYFNRFLGVFFLLLAAVQIVSLC